MALSQCTSLAASSSLAAELGSFSSSLTAEFGFFSASLQQQVLPFYCSEIRAFQGVPYEMEERKPRRKLFGTSLLQEDRVESLQKALSQLPSHPDFHTYASLLKQCAHVKALSEGKLLHEHIQSSAHSKDRLLLNLLIHMYGNCGSLAEARAVFEGIFHPNEFSWRLMVRAYAQNGHLEDARSLFDRMPSRRDVPTWTVMIVAYAQIGNCKEVLHFFRQMELAGVRPDKITFVSVLNVCTHLRMGQEIHHMVIARELDTDTVLGTTLVNMYKKCGSLDDAKKAFEKIYRKDMVAWTAMITGYSQHGYAKEALELYQNMVQEDVKPDKFTFVTVLAACATLANLRQGNKIHKTIVDYGFESDVVVANALINMYGKCGCLDDARAMFEKILRKDVVSWTTMITAYAQNGRGKEALEIFKQMGVQGLKPNKITLISVLEACSSLEALAQGKEVHVKIVACGFESNVAVGNALINMYGNCGSLEDTKSVFDGMPQRDVVTWTALITAYTQNGYAKEALEVFQEMDMRGVEADKIILTSVLDACANLAALALGKKIHATIIDRGIELDTHLGNALVNMYGKCGNVNDARSMFDNMPQRDVFSWTAIITSHAQNCYAKEAHELFQQMGLVGLKPNNITFICILFACSHAGLIDDGWQYFISMSRDYDITPTLEHYGSMIDLIGRAGQLDEAEDLIGYMPFEPDIVTWMSFLGACKMYSDVEQGVHAARNAFRLNPEKSSFYLLLSDIYAAGGRQDDVTRVIHEMNARGVRNSRREVCGNVTLPLM